MLKPALHFTTRDAEYADKHTSEESARIMTRRRGRRARRKAPAARPAHRYTRLERIACRSWIAEDGGDSQRDGPRLGGRAVL